MKKSVLLTGLCVVMLLLTGCGNNSDAGKTTNEPTDVLPTEAFESPIPTNEQSVDPESLYAEVLDKYYNNIINSWESYKENGVLSMLPEDVCFLFPMYMDDPSYLDKVGYCFVDLDDNGVPELLIGMNEDVFSENEVYKNEIYDIYTYDDGEIIHLASSAERCFYKLCEDNTIYSYGSSGAASLDYQHLKLDKNGTELSTIQDIHSSPDNNYEKVLWYLATEAWYDSETGEVFNDKLTEITKDEADGIIAGWPDIATLNLTMFSSYTPQSSN